MGLFFTADILGGGKVMLVGNPFKTSCKAEEIGRLTRRFCGADAFTSMMILDLSKAAGGEGTGGIAVKKRKIHSL